MSMLEWTRDPLGQFKRYTDLGWTCFQDVGRFEECNQVWAVFGIVLGIGCLLALAFIARHFYREYSGYQRMRLRRLAEMEIAAPQVMSQYVWSEEKVLDHGLSQEEMIRHIKEAKALKRAQDTPPRGERNMGVTFVGTERPFPRQ